MKKIIFICISFIIPAYSLIFSQSFAQGPEADHAIVIDNTGSLTAWGVNSRGEFSIGNTTNSNTPVSAFTTGVAAGKSIIEVAVGIDHSVALASDGTVYTTGHNLYGQLGDGSSMNHTSRNSSVAVDVTGVLSGKTITAVAAGQYHTLVLDSDGLVYAWGRNGNGQLGNSSNLKSNVPVAVAVSGTPMDGKTIVAIAAGKYFSVALDDNGDIFAWGDDGSGQLGNGTPSSDSNVPVQVSAGGGSSINGKTINKIVAGSFHVLALASDGSVHGWGENTDAQLGDNSFVDRYIPVAVYSSGNLSGKVIDKISAGSNHSLALASDGTLFSWGENTYGALGIPALGTGGTAQTEIPLEVDVSGDLSGKTVVDITAGDRFSLFLASNGMVYACGDNSYGQLGNGTDGGGGDSANEDEPVEFAGSALPVELVLFDGYTTAEGVELQWKTATEINNYGFDVKRKNAVNGEWEKIGFVQGYGTTNSPKSYSFIDSELPEVENVYYRLKQIDIDGSFEFSKVITVNISNVTSVGSDLENKFSLEQNFPNPFNPTTKIKFSVPPHSEQAKLTVYNLLGKEIATIVNENLQSGNYNVTFNANDLPSGLYIYNLSIGSKFSSTKKMLLLK